MPGFRWRGGWRGRGRPMKPRWIGVVPPARYFVPLSPNQPPPFQLQAAVTLTPDEIEAIRLVDMEGLNQEEAGERMGVSRGTVWRILRNARLKLAKAMVEGRPIVIATHSITSAERREKWKKLG